MVPGLQPPGAPPPLPPPRGGAAVGVDHRYPFILADGGLMRQAPALSILIPQQLHRLTASTTDKEASLKHPTTSSARLPGAVATVLNPQSVWEV